MLWACVMCVCVFVVFHDRFRLEDTLCDNGIVFAKLIELLTACCPNKLVYRKGVAERESEEAALLVQAAVPLKGSITAVTCSLPPQP